MELKIKVYVLSQVHDGEIGEPAVFPTKALAFRTMEEWYYERLRGFGHFIKDETEISDDRAVIVSHDDSASWTIVECELSINGLQGFATVFESSLAAFAGGQFAQFVEKAPQALAQANVLMAILQEMKNLLPTALPEAVGDIFAGPCEPGDGDD